MTDGKVVEDHGVFARVANDLLQNAEHLTARLEKSMDDFWSTATSGVINDEPVTVTESEIPMDTEDYERLIREGLGESPLQGMAETVLGGILEGQTGPQTFWENVNAFRHAINWKEPLLVGIIGFQCFMFLLTLWISRRGQSLEMRLVIMVLIGVIVRGAERLNDYAAQNWQEIATQDYFDERGVFVTALLCTPLLFDSFIMLVCFLREAGSLLIQVKTAELKNKKKTKQSKSSSQAKKKD